MKISTKGRYALRLLLDLASHASEGYIALRDIAERQGISKKYLEQIVPALHKAGILKTNRGYQGGYRLAREPEQITVCEVLRLTEGSLAPVSCAEGDPDCPRVADCLTYPLWRGLYRTVTEYLEGITLRDLLPSASRGDDYNI